MSSRDLLQRQGHHFVDFARSLAPADWAQPSLCTQWTNQEVLAHLMIGYSLSVPALCWGMATHHLNFDDTNTALAQRLSAQHSPQALVDSFELLIDHKRGIGKLFPPRLLVGDHVLHHLDIALALAKPAGIPDDVLNAVLDTEVKIPNPFVPAKRNARDLTLRATDTGWTFSAGRGTRGVVEGHAAHLASALAGRPHALAFLDGDGVATLGARIAHPTAGQHHDARETRRLW